MVYAIRRTYIHTCCCAHFYVVIESHSRSHSKSRKIKYSTYLCQVHNFHVQGDKNQHKQIARQLCNETCSYCYAHTRALIHTIEYIDCMYVSVQLTTNAGIFPTATGRSAAAYGDALPVSCLV